MPIVGACAIGASLVKAKLLRRWQRWVYLPLLVLMCIACLKAQSDIRDSLDRAYGVGRMGPTRVLVVTITNKYVEEEDDDRGNHYDSYRVATSSGDFEDVDKDIFDQLDVGTRYRIATQGNRVHNWWCSSTPEIIDSEPLSPPGRSEDEGR